MKLRPLHDRVVIRRTEEERKSPGGIVIPDTATEKPIKGEVLAVGKGKILENGEVRPLDLKKGDKVLFGKYSGTEVKVDGEDLWSCAKTTSWPSSRNNSIPNLTISPNFQETESWRLQKKFVFPMTPVSA